MYSLTNVILVWVIEGVDYSRLRGPFIHVNRLPKFVKISLGLEPQYCEEVRQEVIGMQISQLEETNYKTQSDTVDARSLAVI